MCVVLTFKSVLNAIQYLETDFLDPIILELKGPSACDILLPYRVEHSGGKTFLANGYSCGTMLVVSTVLLIDKAMDYEIICGRDLLSMEKP